MYPYSLPIAWPAPRAGVDPVTCATDALALFAVVMRQPLEPEVLAVPLDDEGIGHMVTAVGDADDPDCVVLLADVMAHVVACGPTTIRSLVMASVRPHGGLLPDDIDRWCEASATVEQRGLTLIDWFVIGADGVWSPRELLGEAERW
jgi:hypothetical protein